jgi:inner membrane transporter RhtA
MTTTATLETLTPVGTHGAREAAAPRSAPAAAPATTAAAPHSAPNTCRPAIAALLVLGSATSLQAGAAFAIRLFPATGAPGATLLRLGLAAAVLLVLARPRVRGWRSSQWRAVALYGISLAGTNGFFYAALARLPLGTAVTIQFLGPLTLAAALSRRWRDAGWVGLAVAGVLILGISDGHGAGGRPLDPVGVAFVLVSAAFWALYIVAGARVSAAVPGRGGLAAGLAIGALVLLPFGARGAWPVAGRPHLMLLALGTAVLASVVPYTLELAALRRAPRRVFGTLLSLEPAVAALAGLALLGQPVPAVAAGAIALVIAASAGATLGARPPAAATGGGGASPHRSG